MAIWGSRTGIFSSSFSRPFWGASKVHHISGTIGPTVTKFHIRPIHHIIEVGFQLSFGFRILNVFFQDFKQSKRPFWDLAVFKMTSSDIASAIKSIVTAYLTTTPNAPTGLHLSRSHVKVICLLILTRK